MTNTISLTLTSGSLTNGATQLTFTVDTSQTGGGDSNAGYLITAVSGTWDGSSVVSINTNWNNTVYGKNYGFPSNVSSIQYNTGFNIITTNIYDGLSSQGTYVIINGSQTVQILPTGSSTFDYTLYNGTGGGLANAGSGSGTISSASDSVPCFLRGTRIAAEHGPIAVEDLAVGMRVRTLSGALAPVVWIGRRAYHRDWTARRVWPAVAPVRIAAGAIAPGLPSRDLYVSPDHSLFLADHLIPAKNLLNGASIAQDMRMESVEYFHIELERHEVVLAEDLPAETFLDTGNVGLWGNASTRPTPARRTPTPAEAWYAPRALRDHPVLARVRANIAERAPRLAA